MSDSVRPHRRQPTRLPCPWDSPGKNTGVGCHFLLQCVKGKSESEVAQLCPTLRNTTNCSLPGSTQPPGKPTKDFSTLLKYLAHAQPSSWMTSLSTRKVPWLIFHPVSWSPLTSSINGFHSQGQTPNNSTSKSLTQRHYSLTPPLLRQPPEH